jgi:HEPN domain-containing protein
MKQTAVECLERQLDFLSKYMSEKDRNQLFQQAKEIERKQKLKDIQYALLHLQPKIKKVAELLICISDTYDINDIEICLDWMLSTGEIPDEYPKEVMTREYESIIICEVEKTMDKPFGL